MPASRLQWRGSVTAGQGVPTASNSGPGLRDALTGFNAFGIDRRNDSPFAACFADSLGGRNDNMKSILLISVILGTALQTATADGEVGRYQLIAARDDSSSGAATETLYRIDTATGETCRLMHTNMPIPENKQGPGGATVWGCEGWTGVLPGIDTALADAKKAIDAMPDKNSKNP